MKKHWLHTILIIFLLSGVRFYGYAQTGTIKGKVQGREGALQVATVSAENITVLTDKNGEFSLTLKPGIYTLIITHISYKKIIQKIKIETNDTQSFDFILTPLDYIEEAVVLGSRSVIQRIRLNTTVPVDIFSSNNLVQTGHTNLTQIIGFVAPSFNASRQLVNEPVTFRGLDPDQVLIMVNGTRYHNMAYLNDGRVRGTLGRGSVANDLNSIPFSAIEKIEVLRDGASAQYGSDAIAGVINIHLKKSTGKTSVLLHTGQFYSGDGENISLGINRGFPIGKSLADGRQGFLNFSADFRYRNPTSRGGEYKGTVYINNPPLDDSIIQARNFSRIKVSNAGTTKLSSMGILINGGYHIGDKTEMFWTAVFNSRKNIFTGSYIFFKNPRQVNTDLYPDGFKPLSKQNILDISTIAGIKGETKNKWHWEYNSAYGSNDGKYYSENTNNASQYFTLGKNAPTKFYTGTLNFQQLTNNISFAKDFSTKIGGIKLFNIALGGEWRLENYQIKAGEEAAWQNFDSILQRKQGGSQNGLIFRPENVANENRSVVGSYVDVESEFATNLLIDLAGRYEYYDDFGVNVAGKIAARYKFSDKFSLRSSLSKGFRAPSLQQKYYSNTSKGSVISGGGLVPVISGIFCNNSVIANAFGIPSLQPEKSVNLSGGFTSRLDKHMNLTVDAYWIQIRNRVVLSGRFDKNNPDVKRILQNYPDIDQVQFITNAINTKTRGIDIVMNGDWNIRKAVLGIMLAANFTRTNIFGPVQLADSLKNNTQNTNTLFNIEEKEKLERGQPGSKIILSTTLSKGKFEFVFRNTRFGNTASTTVFTNPSDTLYEFFSPKILSDISVNYTLKSWLTITAGANNVFNVYPDRLKNYRNTGEGIFVYSQEASPFGYNGGYYFVSMAFNF